jgi:hypothetical protein
MFGRLEDHARPKPRHPGSPVPLSCFPTAKLDVSANRAHTAGQISLHAIGRRSDPNTRPRAACARNRAFDRKRKPFMLTQCYLENSALRERFWLNHADVFEE